MNKKLVFLVIGVIGALAGSMTYLNFEKSPSILYDNDSETQTNLSDSVLVLQAQFSQTPYHRKVISSEMILVGTIIDIQTKLVDTSYETYSINEKGEKDGDIINNISHTPFQFVTVNVDEYLKDVTNTFSETFTFKDFGSGTGIQNENQIQVISENEVKHNVGDKALFFISDSDFGWVSYGYSQKFALDNNDNISVPALYSQSSSEFPNNLNSAKIEIENILEVNSSVKEFLELETTKQNIKEATIQLNQKGFSINERGVTRTLEEIILQEKMSGKNTIYDLSVIVSEIEKTITVPNFSEFINVTTSSKT
ncbi:MAG: hypothetical protein OEL77_02870 [Nitrosopumilus sp.]|nr:hypothetical protein [Nitrosopumilus sp.]MDH3384937.1 hypothetical protein [Nitrosopumilus sp.]